MERRPAPFVATPLRAPHRAARRRVVLEELGGSVVEPVEQRRACHHTPPLGHLGPELADGNQALHGATPTPQTLGRVSGAPQACTHVGTGAG